MIFGFSLLTGGYPGEHQPSSSNRAVASLEAEGFFPFHWSKRNCAVLRQSLVSLRRESGKFGDGTWCTDVAALVHLVSKSCSRRQDVLSYCG